MFVELEDAVMLIEVEPVGSLHDLPSTARREPLRGFVGSCGLPSFAASDRPACRRLSLRAKHAWKRFVKPVDDELSRNRRENEAHHPTDHVDPRASEHARHERR